MSKSPSPKRKLAVSLVLLVLTLAVAAGATAAIYTSQVFQRSVVRNRDNEAIRFSSDKLYRVAIGTDPQKYYYPMGQGQNTVTFQVCNFDQNKPTLFNEEDIEYTLTLTISNGTNNFGYTISDGTQIKTVQNGGSVNFDNTLRGERRSTNTYTITFGEEDYNKVELSVIARPNNNTVTKNMELNGILIPIKYATTQGVSVTSGFPDSVRGTPDKFDAYNLSVSISGGSGDVVITWENDKLDIDPFFLKKVNATPKVNGTTSTLTIHMNSEDATSAYLIQFYNHNQAKPDWKAWNELPITVALASE